MIDQVERQVRYLAASQLRNQIKHWAQGLVESQILRHVTYQVCRQVSDQVRFQVTDQVENRVLTQVHNREEDKR